MQSIHSGSTAAQTTGKAGKKPEKRDEKDLKHKASRKPAAPKETSFCWSRLRALKCRGHSPSMSTCHHSARRPALAPRPLDLRTKWLPACERGAGTVQVSLPGGAASELDVVMKLHKVEKHIRKNKLKVRTRCTCASGPTASVHAIHPPCSPAPLLASICGCMASSIPQAFLSGADGRVRCDGGVGGRRLQVTLSGEIGAAGGKELSSKAQARRLAFYLFWNIKADFTRNFIVQEDLEHFLPSRKAARAFALLDTDRDGKVCRPQPRTPDPTTLPAYTCPPATTLCHDAPDLVSVYVGHW